MSRIRWPAQPPQAPQVEIDGHVVAESGGHRYEVRGEGSALVLHAPGIRAGLHLAGSGRSVARDLGDMLRVAGERGLAVVVKVRGRTIARSDEGRIRVRPFALLLAGIGRERPQEGASGR